MKINFPVEETVKKRYSVRNYQDQAIESDKLKAIEVFIASLENPFGPNIKFHTLDIKTGPNTQKLDTYGVIKGASHYIGTTITPEPLALEALGYEFEALVLYLADLGLGTCWLGGTFDRQSFSNAMQIEAGEIFPIITPFGYAADHKHFKEKAMRKLIKADQRKEWPQLFFNNDFFTKLTAFSLTSIISTFLFCFEIYIPIGPHPHPTSKKDNLSLKSIFSSKTLVP